MTKEQFLDEAKELLAKHAGDAINDIAGVLSHIANGNAIEICDGIKISCADRMRAALDREIAEFFDEHGPMCVDLDSMYDDLQTENAMRKALATVVPNKKKKMAEIFCASGHTLTGEEFSDAFMKSINPELKARLMEEFDKEYAKGGIPD